MTARFTFEQAVQRLMERESHETLARVVVKALATAWALPEWESETIECVMEELDRARHSNLPERGDDDLWAEIAISAGIYESYTLYPEEGEDHA